MNKKAFTLAEVLITLLIVGIIAMLAIPALINKVNNHAFANQFKKNYANLQNAVSIIVAEEGQPSTWDWSGQHNDVIVSFFEKKLKIAKKCTYSGSLSIKPCYANPREVKFLNQSLAGDPYWCVYSFLLDDGTSVAFRFASLPNGVFWDIVQSGGDMHIIIDVNGSKKPNIIGRDIFYLVFNQGTGKLLPYGLDKASDCIPGGKGYSCSAKILQENNINY